MLKHLVRVGLATSILELRAYLRQGQPLPRHFGRSHTPANVVETATRRSTYRRVASDASHRLAGTPATRTAHYQRTMQRHLIPLRRRVAIGMAVQASRVLKHLAGLNEEG